MEVVGSLSGVENPPEESSTVRAGNVVAHRYEILRKIADGGMGTVYLANDSKFGVEVAIKIAAPTGTLYEEFRSRFQREARMGYLLGKTEGFVRALDWGELEEEQRLYMAVDLVPEATELNLREGDFQRRLTSLLACSALVARLHQEGIVHRDIKPGNFLVSKDGRIYLSDFGEAKRVADPSETMAPVDTSTRSGSLVGTPLFMSPEQFKDPRAVDYRSDVYALGVMLYQCLTGNYPYEGKGALQIMTRQVQTRYGEIPPPAPPSELGVELSEELELLCMAAISLDSSKRPRSGGTFQRELLRCLAGKDAVPDTGVESGRYPALGSTTEGALPGTPSGLWDTVGLDLEGFTSARTLRRMLKERGREGFRAMLKGTPALYARQERTVDGSKRYEGRVALLLHRDSGDPASQVTVGRSTESDLVLNLATTSKRHATFLRRPGSWEIVDEGSRNGTAVGGVPLRPGQARPISDRDDVCFSRHLWVDFLLPDSLIEELGRES